MEVGNSGSRAIQPAWAKETRIPSATALAMAMRTMDRGRHSKTSNSTPSTTAATGVPNTALMPPAAPATSRLRRSMADRWKNCAITDPRAPPVRMIGPSAPNGPPVPMLTALEMGLRAVSLGSTLLPPTRMVSIASGMPCPRIRSEPYRAMSPTTRLPITGMPIATAPR
jgi:hypothetical protein